MKKIFTLFFVFVSLGLSNAQQASDYFPATTGFEWKFKIVPLDSLNNPLPALAEFRIDSFATVENYEGKPANIVTTKTGLLQTIFLQPYEDSLFYYNEGSNGFEFFSISNIEEFLSELDSGGIDPNFNFVNFFKSLQNWYPIYKFASNINSEYTLLSKDTTISTYNIRVQLTGTRLADENIQTVLGALSCKKFLTQLKISTLLGPFVIELFTIKNSFWIAQGNWIVQDIIPSQIIDLTLLGIPPFTIYGREIKLTDELLGVDDEGQIPLTAHLEQNYPNPFNPSTTISWQSSVSGHQTLRVFDVLGNELATLVDEYKPAGEYNVQFTINNLSAGRQGLQLGSGIYFYQLKSGSFVQTRKMVLIK
ncbi:MAG: T9SS type A sorting domain-containing protein [Ignavibacterium sp.]|jgi:hypothetical protein|nr:T9SS type A sorting domain-containing protein [Ignavibacterium sp.]